MDGLAWLGAGRIPLSLMLMILSICWGTLGLVISRVTWVVDLPQWAMPLISLPLAGIAAGFLTRSSSRLVARFMPMRETFARPKDALVGSTGVALTRIDGAFGLVQVRDRVGGVFQYPCRVPADRPAITQEQRVLLVDYDEQARVFYVIPDELGDTLKKQQKGG